MLPHPSECWLVIVSTVSGLSCQFRLQIATLHGGKGDKPYKIMMPYTMSSTVGVESYDAGQVLSRTLVNDIICVHQHVSKVM